jgi:hypothetical protein
VIVDLAFVFARNAFVPAGVLDVSAVAMAVLAFVALQRWHLGMPLVIGASALLGAAVRLWGS